MSINQTKRQSVALDNIDRPYDDENRFTREHESRQRLRQLRRVLHVAYIIRREPCLTVSEISQTLVNHFDFKFCRRTILRDVRSLVDLGVVEGERAYATTASGRGVSVITYQFSDDLAFWPFGGAK